MLIANNHPKKVDKIVLKKSKKIKILLDTVKVIFFVVLSVWRVSIQIRMCL